MRIWMGKESGAPEPRTLLSCNFGPSRGIGDVALLAVHISDNVLEPLILGVGIFVAVLLILPAMFRVEEDEIPRIGLLTAAFFVASLIHIKLGVTSVHMLLNGLVGVILGRRAPLAIVIALGLQALLLGHGGFTSLGVNAVVMSIPALMARCVFVAIARSFPISSRRVWIAGFVAGGLAVVLAALLNALVLLVAGIEDFRIIATLGFAVHLPLAAIEAVIVGVTTSYLARVKPEMLGLARRIE